MAITFSSGSTVWNQCSPRIISVDESCGCTLTRATITGMTPDAFQALGTQETDYQRVIGQAAEAKLIGVPERTLRDLLMSNVKDIKGSLSKEPVVNQSVILPYIYRTQRSNVNTNYFTIEAGAAAPGAGTGNLPAHAWQITVNTGPSAFASPLDELWRFFLPGQTIFIHTVVTAADSGSTGLSVGTSLTLAFEIISASEVDNAGVVKAAVVIVPNYTLSGFLALTSAQQAVYQPTFGTVMVGANSVSDYESWCYNEAAVNSRKLLTYWVQTSRETFCYNDEYLKALEGAYTQEYFKKFRELPLAEQNRQQRASYERKWLNSVFYGQGINENQTPTTYTSLPTVTDIEDNTCTYEYKANAYGIRTQLSNCSKTVDLSGGTLSLDTLFQSLYNLKRNREASGGTIDTIDAMTDRLTADNIRQIMTTYYKTKYNVATERFYNPGQKLVFDNQVMFNYDLYQLPEVGVDLAVFNDPFFNDYLAAFTTGANNASGNATQNIATRGRLLWLIDWSDVAIGIAGTMAVRRNYPDPNVVGLYKCVITPNVKHYELRSTKWTVIIEDPNRHAIYENFSAACPTLTVAGCAVGTGGSS